MTITPEKDVIVLLGRKIFPRPLTHLCIETETVTHKDDDGLSITRIAAPPKLNVYHGEKLLASTQHFYIGVKSRVIRLWKKDTQLH